MQCFTAKTSGINRVLACFVLSVIMLSAVLFPNGVAFAASGVGSSAVISSIMPLVTAIAKTYWERPNELISSGKYMSEIIQKVNMISTYRVG